MNLKQKLAIQYVRAQLHILTLVSPKQAAKKAFALFCTPRRKSRRRLSPLFDGSNVCPSDNEPLGSFGRKSFPSGWKVTPYAGAAGCPTRLPPARLKKRLSYMASNPLPAISNNISAHCLKRIRGAGF